MEQIDRISARVNSLISFPFRSQGRELGRRLPVFAAVDLRRARVRLRRTAKWLWERDRRLTEASYSYVREEKRGTFSAADLVLAEVGMILGSLLVLVGAGGGIPMPVLLSLFLVSATLFASFARRAVGDLVAEVEPEV